jgi:hypothetical protein
LNEKAGKKKNQGETAEFSEQGGLFVPLWSENLKLICLKRTVHDFFFFFFFRSSPLPLFVWSLVRLLLAALFENKELLLLWLCAVRS